MMSALLKVLGHDDRAVGFALREKHGGSIARGGEVRCPGNRVLLQRDYRGEATSLKAVIHDRWGPVQRSRRALVGGRGRSGFIPSDLLRSNCMAAGRLDVA